MMFKFGVLLLCVAAVSALPAATVPEVDPEVDTNGSSRIVGGTNSPHHTAMCSLRSSGNSHFCGGTKLNSLNILTAAHCIVGRSTGNTITVCGTTQLNSGGTSRGSSALLIHANYNANTIANDIAVIRLSSTLGATATIQPVSLSTANIGAAAGRVIGWGRTSTNGPIPNNRQQLNVQIITHANCVSSWGSLVTNTQICISTPAGQGVCQGDSGGPLFLISNGAQAGIASFIRAGGCGQAFPDVYVRVPSFISWIQSAVAW